MFSDELDLDPKETDHPYDDPLWYRKFISWNHEDKLDSIKRIAKRLKDFGNVHFVGVSPKIAYVMVDGEDADPMWVHGFSMPTLLLWKEDPKNLVQHLRYNPSHYMPWFKAIQTSSNEERRKVRDRIIESISSKNRVLSKKFDNKDIQIIGFTPRIDYFSMDKNVSNKRCFYIPTLLCWDKDMECLIIFNMEITEPLIISNPVLRYDDTILNAYNSKKEGIRGITG